tara:strand:- start:386 stop:1315 length:930 start_codon:yes stop_codon:yes gene_type:complete
MSKNLIIRISNGLGNQLFMYASAYGISKNLTRNLLIDNESGFKSSKNISDYLLNNFEITSEIAPDENKFNSTCGYLKRKLLLKTDFFRKNKFFYLEKKNQDKITYYTDDFKNKLFNYNMYVEGYFESEKYFANYKSSILSEFKFKNPYFYQNNSFFNSIRHSNSVALCIRQNRFIEGRNNNNELNRKKSWDFTLEQIDYINKSVEVIKSKISNAKFYLWSNDFKNLDSNFFNFDYQNINLDELNDSVDKRILGLYLLTNCKHFVVTSSSFNWWGAWLSTNQNKIIIRPSHFKNFTINNKDLWPEKWLSV